MPQTRVMATNTRALLETYETLCRPWTPYLVSWGCRNIYNSWENSMSSRTVTSLGHQVERRVFWEGPKFFELCPVVLNHVQHIFLKGRTICRGFRPPSGYGPDEEHCGVYLCSYIVRPDVTLYFGRSTRETTGSLRAR